MNYKIVYCSCHCGGSLAWVEVNQLGMELMLGCICHHTPEFLINVPLKVANKRTENAPLTK